MIGGSRWEIIPDPNIMLIKIHPQRIPGILREIMHPMGFEPTSLI